MLLRTRPLTPALAIAVALSAPATAMAHPGSAIVVDRLGQIWFLDTGAGLWKIDTRGALIHVGGNRFHWMALDQDGRFRGASLPRDVTLVGTSPSLLIASDFPIATGRDGSLYYPAGGPNGPIRIMRATPTGLPVVVATLPANTAAGTPLRWLNGLAAGPHGDLYFTEDNAVRRVTRDGQVRTVASGLRVPGCTAIPGIAPSDGPFLRGLSVDSAGVIYVAASGCGALLEITPEGRVTKLVQTEAPWAPTAVALFGSNLYVLEYLHTETEDRRAWIPRVRRVSGDGTSVVIATVAR